MKGFNRIIEDARNKLDELDMTLPENIEKSNFYHAIIVCAEAIILLNERYAQHAEQLAFQEKDTDRKKELITIAKNCRHVPGNPPENFWQAVQMLWTVQLGNSLFENAVALNIGRFDQFMYPFYARDIDNGTITK